MVLEVEHVGFVVARLGFAEDVGEEDDLKLVQVEYLRNVQQQQVRVMFGVLL